jgi:hypothetical protein
MEEQHSNAGQGLGIAGLVLGIIALIIAFIPCFGWVAIVPGAVALVLSIVGLSQATKVNAPKGVIIAALVISIIGTSVAAIWGVLLTSVAHEGGRWVNRFERVGKEFEKEFKDETGSDIEETMDKMDKDLDKTMDEMGKEMEKSLKKMDTLSDEEKAARMGRAAGKALKEFQKALEDTTKSK